jgi:integrase/recombinase XerD
VTPLRQIMTEELERRNYASSTIRAYVRTIEHFARSFRCPPVRLGSQHIRRTGCDVSRLEVVSEHGHTAARGATLPLHPGAEAWLELCRDALSEKVLRLPQVLSQQEAARLIDAGETPFHRVLLMTLYVTGARRAEVALLKISDSQGRMHRHVGNPMRLRIDMAASGTRRGNVVCR